MEQKTDMTVKKPGLGKRNSLGMLLSNISSEIVEKSQEDTAKSKLSQLPIEKICRGKYQPRKHMDSLALQELADSIKAQGIIQPIVVRLIAEGEYEIIAGERRWRAAQLAGLETVPVVIKNVADDAAIAMALIENIQRENLNPIEEAIALQRLMDEFIMTHQEVAAAVGKPRTTITNLLRLLSLNEDVKLLVAEGKLDLGHAKVLLALTGNQQSQIARLVALKELSVRETEVLIKKSQAVTVTPKKTSTTNPNIKHFENELSEKLGAKISIEHQSSGKGKLIIYYNNVDELQGISEHIK